jgi:rRNA maturation RNase YbeY
LQDAERNAKLYRVSLEQELMRLVVHGILHLLGYDDKNPEKQFEMKKLENRIIKDYMFLTK